MSARRLAPVLFALLGGAGCGIVLETAPLDAADAATQAPWPDATSAADASAWSDADASAWPAADASAWPDATSAADASSYAPSIVSMARLPMADRVRDGDGKISTDSRDDGAFEVVLRGSIVAFALLQTQADGTPTANQQWDTYVGNDAIPPSLASAFVRGDQTFQLGVFDGMNLQNDPQGRCPIEAGAERTLQIYASDVGSFVTGKSFRLWVETPTHELIAGPVFTFP